MTRPLAYHRTMTSAASARRRAVRGLLGAITATLVAVAAAPIGRGALASATSVGDPNGSASGGSTATSQAPDAIPPDSTLPADTLPGPFPSQRSQRAASTVLNALMGLFPQASTGREHTLYQTTASGPQVVPCDGFQATFPARPKVEINQKRTACVAWLEGLGAFRAFVTVGTDVKSLDAAAGKLPETIARAFLADGSTLTGVQEHSVNGLQAWRFLGDIGAATVRGTVSLDPSGGTAAIILGITEDAAYAPASSAFVDSLARQLSDADVADSYLLLAALVPKALQEPATAPAGAAAEDYVLPGLQVTFPAPARISTDANTGVTTATAVGSGGARFLVTSLHVNTALGASGQNRETLLQALAEALGITTDTEHKFDQDGWKGTLLESEDGTLTKLLVIENVDTVAVVAAQAPSAEAKSVLSFLDSLATSPKSMPSADLSVAPAGTVTVPTIPGMDLPLNQDVVVTGDALDPLPESARTPADDPEVGAKAPALEGKDFAGKAVSIKPGDGTVHVLVFAAHWCPHCNNEMPILKDWVASADFPKGAVVTIVSTGVRPGEAHFPPGSWLLHEVGWTGQILVDNADNAAGQAYGLRSFPYTVIIGGDGTVKARVAGEVSAEKLTALVNAASGTGSGAGSAPGTTPSTNA